MSNAHAPYIFGPVEETITCDEAGLGVDDSDSHPTHAFRALVDGFGRRRGMGRKDRPVGKHSLVFPGLTLRNGYKDYIRRPRRRV